MAGGAAGFFDRTKLDSAQFHAAVAASAAGDATATGRLLTWLRPEIVRYCQVRIVDQGVHYSVPDVVQEICLAILGALPKFRHDAGSFLPYMYGIAANKISDRHRKAGSDRSLATANLPDRADHRSAPDQVAILRADAGRTIRLMLRTLSPVQQQVLVLRIIHGLTATETARITGLAVDTVRVTQHRALRKLRTQLARVHDDEVYRTT